MQVVSSARLASVPDFLRRLHRSRASAMSVKAGTAPVVMAIGCSEAHNVAAARALNGAGYGGRCFIVDHMEEAKQELSHTPYDLVMFGVAVPMAAPEAGQELKAFIQANCPETQVYQLTKDDVVKAGFETPQGPPTPEMVGAYALAVAKRLMPIA